MAGRAKENLPGGSLKYLFLYLKIRIFKCSYRIYIYTYWILLNIYIYSDIRNSIWHSFWHTLWPSLWHSTVSGIYSDTLSGIYADILSGILSGIYSDILSGIYSGILCGILSDILFCSLMFSIWHLFWHSILPFYLAFHLALSGISSAIPSDMGTAGPQPPPDLSGSAHWDLELVVEVPLRFGVRVWGPAVPAEIWSSLLGAGRKQLW